MNRSEIFDVVKSYMIEIVDDMDETTEIPEDIRMADLGADSIDVVEIVSDSMRELQDQSGSYETGQRAEYIRATGSSGRGGCA